MRTWLIRLFIAAGVVAVLSLGSGCASPSQATNMAPTVMVANQHPQSVAINVTGGSETNAMMASQISNEAFAEALREAITRSKVFAEIAGGTDAALRLDVFIARLDQPMFGLDMKVTIETGWTLTDTASGSVVWKRAIVTDYVAEFGDALAGVKRLRLANEGAARRNIEEALQTLGGLDLVQPSP